MTGRKVLMSDIDRILHAEEVLSDYKPLLLDYYVEEYGKKYRSLLEKRLDSVIYLFDSPPDITYQFFLDHETEFNNTKEFLTLKYQAFEYTQVRKSWQQSINRVMQDLLQEQFGVSSREMKKIREEVLELNFACFRSQYQQMLVDESVEDSIKRGIKNQQEEYFRKCDELKISAITDSEVIDSILNKKEKMSLFMKRMIFLSTSWGKSIQEKIGITSKSSRVLYQCIASTLIDNPDMGGKFLKCLYNSSYSPIILLPLITHFTNCSIDDIFFHETRHLMETNEVGTGIYRYKNYRFYKFLNEIRTEKHAMQDDEHLRTIFSKIPEEEYRRSYYCSFFPITFDLFEKYGYLFDEWAVCNNIEEMEQVLGKTEILEYAQMLNDTHKKIENYRHITQILCFAREPFQEKVEKLEQNAMLNGKAPYQKVRK